MNTAKKVSWTIAVSMAMGAILGLLYAPCEGARIRRKIYKLKRKLSCADHDGMNDDRESLEDLRDALQNDLDMINDRLEKQK